MFDSASANMMGLQSIKFMLPEIIMTVGLLAVLSITMLVPKKTSEENNAIMQTSLLFILGALGALMWSYSQLSASLPQAFFAGTLTADQFSFIIRALILAGSGITVAMSSQYIERHTRVVGDFYALVMGASLGGMFLASASDLMTVFVGLETLSITSYILAGYLRKTAKGAEASLKYLVYGGASTAIFLFGLSLVYGLAGSTNFKEIGVALAQYHAFSHPMLVVMMLMVTAALAFKLSAAPFHMWAPDVYEGAPTPVTAFLSVVSKTAAFGVAIRMIVTLFSLFNEWTLLLGILSVLSMIIGNFVALRQSNIKRLLAYSTIAHAGYMLLGLLIGTTVGLAGILYYLITYLFMNLGAFACVIFFNDLTKNDDIAAYSGLIQKRPGLTFAFSICLLSLAGIPITSGFFAKFFLFQAVAQVGPVYLILIIIAMLNSTVSLAYYVNVIRLMVVKEPSSAVQSITTRQPMPYMLSLALSISVIATLVLGIYATPFFQFSKSSADQLAQQRLPIVSQAPTEK